ncbi:hypothetical protein ONA70_26075 [Micromonospora yasonensis]|uniref:hypothetical protein n=1 Tax=Micromonospora yasonensis TaxID=1128667 RepID=UPI00222F339C|nr:hypothetical protein [Micromonospora yasonensis]MCW3843576.1 hypothetical protein [Micromonospora yasonensis]
MALKTQRVRRSGAILASTLLSAGGLMAIAPVSVATASASCAGTNVDATARQRPGAAGSERGN